MDPNLNELRTQIESLEAVIESLTNENSELKQQNLQPPAAPAQEPDQELKSRHEKLQSDYQSVVAERDKLRIKSDYPDVDLDILGQGTFDDLKARAAKFQERINSIKKPQSGVPASPAAPASPPQPPAGEPAPETGSRWDNAPQMGGSVDQAKANQEIQDEKVRQDAIARGDADTTLSLVLARNKNKLVRYP